jgi:HEPN domain-containing protein
MPRDNIVPGSVADWIARARGDLAIAKAPLPEGAFLEDLCFHTQQAAEKSLKAVYLRFGWVFRYTHDLEILTSGLIERGLNVPPDVIEGIELTGFAWESRYPGLSEPLSMEEYSRALLQAQRIVDWAAEVVRA